MGLHICAMQSYIALEPVPYAENGTFSVNLWAHAHNASDAAFGYLFSHQPTQDEGLLAPLNWGPDQVHMRM
jgi:hypothetical protein